jgi:hypothetical protein
VEGNAADLVVVEGEYGRGMTAASNRWARCDSWFHTKTSPPSRGIATSHLLRRGRREVSWTGQRSSLTSDAVSSGAPPRTTRPVLNVSTRPGRVTGEVPTRDASGRITRPSCAGPGYAAKSETVYLVVAEHKGAAVASCTLDDPVNVATALTAGTHQTGLAVTQMPTGTYDPAGYAHFVGVASKVAVSTGLTVSGPDWTTPVEECLSPGLELLGPALDVTATSFSTCRRGWHGCLRRGTACTASGTQRQGTSRRRRTGPRCTHWIPRISARRRWGSRSRGSIFRSTHPRGWTGWTSSDSQHPWAPRRT